MGLNFKKTLATMALPTCMMALIIGCGSQSDFTQAKSAAKATSSMDPASDMAKGYRDEAPLHQAARQIGADRNVIRQGQLGANVADVNKAEQSIKEAVTGVGGYILADVGHNLATQDPSITMTIRVPEKSFDSIVTQIEHLGQLVDKNISSSDVTEEILDIEARIKSSKAQYGEGNPNVVQMKNQQDALKLRSNMSTIYLVLQQKPNALMLSSANASWTGDTWNSALTSAMGAFRVVGACAIWLLVYSPIWGSIVLLAWFLHRQKRKTTASI